MHFISHSSLDKSAALDLRDRLLARGYDAQQIFLDSDEDCGIAAGAKWEQVLYERLKDCRALVVLCSPHWQQSKWCFAELVYAKMAGKEVFPVVLADCDLSAAGEHQAVFVNKEGDAAYSRLFNTLEVRHLGPKDHLPWPHPELRDVYGQPDECPFPGLPAFDERYAAVYFGRERETQVVLEELRQMRSRGEPRLLMIVGGSGSGKSSLLMAGVLPRLKHTTARADWLVLPTLRFGRRNYPDALFESLAEEIVARYPPDAADRSVSVPDRKTLCDQFAIDDAAKAGKAFVDAARDLTFACGCKDATVLLPVDQFEEFLPPSGGAHGTKFLKFLEQVCQHRNDRLLVIGTMRSDYLDVYERQPHALKAPTFYPWRLEPFPREQIENVIVKPAARAHVEVTPELLEHLKKETPTTDALPLLAFTLEKLYRAHAADNKLDLSEYKSLGGMEGSIRHTAQQIMTSNSMPPSVESAVRLSFVRHLVDVNDKGEFVRLTARWEDFDTVAQSLLEQFVSQRLLLKTDRNGEVLVEVAHEAMFRCWEQLNTWLQSSADLLKWRRELRPGWFVWGLDLSLGEKWLKKQPDELRDAERRRITWGRRLRLSFVTTLTLAAAVMVYLTVDSNIAKQRALLNQQLATEAEERAKNSATLASISQTNAEKGEREARKQTTAAVRATHIASARQLATQAQLEYTRFPLRGLLLAAAAAETVPSEGQPEPYAEQVLRNGLLRIGGYPVGGTPEGVRLLLATSPDGEWVLTNGPEKVPLLWKLRGFDPGMSCTPLSSVDYVPYDAQFSPSGNCLFLGDRSSGTYYLADLTVPNPAAALTKISRQRSGILSKAIFSPDSQWLLLQFWNQPWILCSLDSQGRVTSEIELDDTKAESESASVVFSPDLTWLVVIRDQKSLLWDLRTIKSSTAPFRLQNSGSIGDRWVLFSPDSKLLVTYGYTPKPKLWNLESRDPTGNMVELNTTAQSAVENVSFSSDGTWLLTEPALWKLNGSKVNSEPVILKIPSLATTDTIQLPPSDWGSWRFVGRDQRLVAMDYGSTSRWSWDLTAADIPASLVSLSGNSRVSTNGRWLVEYPKDKTARLWDLDQHNPEDDASHPLPGSTVHVTSFSPDLTRLAVGYDDGAIRVFDLSNQAGPSHRDLRLNGIVPQKLLFSPAGKWMLALENGGAPQIFRVAPDKAAAFERLDSLPVRFHSITEMDSSFAFSPDESWLVAKAGLFDEPLAFSWNLKAPKIDATMRTLRGHEEAISYMTFVGDGNALLTSSFNGNSIADPRLWDLRRRQDGALPCIYNSAISNALWTRFSVDSRWLVSLDYSGKEIEFYDVGSRTFISSKEVGSSIVYATDSIIPRPTFSENGRWLLAHTNTNSLHLYDLSGVKPVYHELPGSEGTSFWKKVIFDRNGDWLAAIRNSDNAVFLWQLGSGGASQFPLATPDTCTDLAFDESGTLVIISRADDTSKVHLLNCAAVPIRTDSLPVLIAETKSELSFSPGKRWLIVNDGRLLESVTGRFITLADPIPHPQEYRKVHPETKSSFSYTLSPDDRWAVGLRHTREGHPGYGLTTTSFTWQRIYDLDSVTVESPAYIHPKIGEAEFAGFSPDSKHWVTVDEKGAGHVFPMGMLSTVAFTGEEFTIPVSGLTRKVSFSTRGDFLTSLSGGRLSLLRLAETSNGAMLLRGMDFGESQFRSPSIQFSADDQIVCATTGETGSKTIALWRTSLPSDRIQPVSFEGDVLLDISPDGRWVAIRGKKYEIEIHPLTVSTLIEESRRLSGRQLSEIERLQFLPSANSK